MMHLKSNDWIDFEKEHPRAMAFLRDRMIKNELAALKVEKLNGTITDWQLGRLNELNAIFGEE